MNANDTKAIYYGALEYRDVARLLIADFLPGIKEVCFLEETHAIGKLPALLVRVLYP